MNSFFDCYVRDARALRAERPIGNKQRCRSAAEALADALHGAEQLADLDGPTAAHGLVRGDDLDLELLGGSKWLPHCRGCRGTDDDKSLREGSLLEEGLPQAGYTSR